ncbi:hypothetical protein CHS0354_040436 [Potamilus streckersoni]|uniref:Globin domain-containing protein n=1 Tax=Potamilus streckersoni TaxID=2493646 RepID=A0AAE0SZY8_9BIVA|nr:hypothetical protein CHS0354_040436 [Potamilus streckersoni]
MECLYGCDRSKKQRTYLDDSRRSVTAVDDCQELLPNLTADQKCILEETWGIVQSDISKVGVVLFMRLFEKCPNVQDLFVPLRGLSSEELRNSDRLREHGMRVMGIIEKCVARLHRPDQLEKLLLDLGQKHVYYNVKPDYIDLFGPQLQLAIKPAIGDRWTSEVEEAWSAFLNFISHIIKNAMTF